jgi:hypothetical protein
MAELDAEARSAGNAAAQVPRSALGTVECEDKDLVREVQRLAAMAQAAEQSVREIREALALLGEVIGHGG